MLRSEGKITPPTYFLVNVRVAQAWTYVQFVSISELSKIFLIQLFDMNKQSGLS